MLSVKAISPSHSAVEEFLLLVVRLLELTAQFLILPLRLAVSFRQCTIQRISDVVSVQHLSSFTRRRCRSLVASIERHASITIANDSGGGGTTRTSRTRHPGDWTRLVSITRAMRGTGKMYKVLQRQRDNDRQVAESLQAEQAAWQRETVQAQQSAESLQTQVVTLQDEKTKLQNQLLDVRRKQTAIFGSFLAVAEPPKPHKQPSSAAAACNHTPLVEALPLDSHTFATSEEDNRPVVEGTHLLAKIAKLEQDLADERTKTKQALAKAENWRLQAMISPIARRRPTQRIHLTMNDSKTRWRTCCSCKVNVTPNGTKTFSCADN